MGPNIWSPPDLKDYALFMSFAKQTYPLHYVQVIWLVNNPNPTLVLFDFPTCQFILLDR